VDNVLKKAFRAGKPRPYNLYAQYPIPNTRFACLPIPAYTINMSRTYKTIIILILSTFLMSGCAEEKVGLYEYVRKARKYMDENKYQKALMLLHKAYEELPDSKDIRENLMYGYIKYSAYLEKRDDLDGALEYLDMAYEMDPYNKGVSNNLSYLYCKKAYEFSKNKDYALAMDYIKRSIGVAVRSKKIMRNISAYLFNLGMDAHNKNDGKTVFIFLNGSYVLNPRFESLFMLGKHFYDKADLDRAEFYWDKAAEMKPDDAGTRKHLEQVKKEIIVRDKMEEIRTDYFHISLYKEYDIDVDLLQEYLTDIYQKVGKDLKYYPPADTPIIFYTEEDFRSIFKQKGIIRAFFDGSIRMFINTSTDDPRFRSIIIHEYTHAVISLLTDNRSPIWMHEGLAVFEQARYDKHPSGFVKAYIDQGNKLQLENIESGFNRLDEEALIGLSYEWAYTAILFILDKWGWKGVRGLLQRVKDGQHYANAIDEEFYISDTTFEKMWNRFVKEKYS
jgi:tetratricopeptide (TPR) repeat protein